VRITKHGCVHFTYIVTPSGEANFLRCSIHTLQLFFATVKIQVNIRNYSHYYYYYYYYYTTEQDESIDKVPELYSEVRDSNFGQGADSSE
jgi:hypothetical protein